MKKAELISCVATKAGLSKKDAEKAVSAVIDSIVETVAAGEKVQFVGFGTFELRERAERKGRNPQTKEEITIAASKVPVFKAGREFKNKVSK